MRKRKQETRKRKRVHKNKSRRHKRYTNKNHTNKSRKQKGGNYEKDVTDNEVDGIPVTEDAVITIPGYPSMSVDAFEDHAEYIDFQGLRT